MNNFDIRITEEEIDLAMEDCGVDREIARELLWIERDFKDVIGEDG